jgi:hypothetical protein
MLLGFRDESFEVGDWKKGTFFISATVAAQLQSEMTLHAGLRAGRS